MATLDSADLAAIGRLIHRTRHYAEVLHDGNDATSGAALVTAFAAAQPGTAVMFSPGTYDTGASRLVIPAGVKGVGPGIGLAKVTTTEEAVAYVTSLLMGDGSEMSDCTIEDSTLSDVQRGFAAGAMPADAAFSDAVLRRVRLLAKYDCVRINNASPCSLALFECLLRSEYDGVYPSGAAHRVDLYDSHIDCVGPGTDDGVNRGVVVSDAARLRTYGGSIRVTDSFNAAAGVEASGSGRVELYDTPVYVSAPDADEEYSLQRIGDDAAIVVSGGAYDRATTSGMVDEVPTGDTATTVPDDARVWRVDSTARTVSDSVLAVNVVRAVPQDTDPFGVEIPRLPSGVTVSSVTTAVLYGSGLTITSALPNAEAFLSGRIAVGKGVVLTLSGVAAEQAYRLRVSALCSDGLTRSVICRLEGDDGSETDPEEA